MRLVDGDEGELLLCQHFRKAGDAKAFGGDEEELQAAVEVVDAGLAGGGAIQAGMDAGDAKSERGELGDLVFHERDQGRDDKRSASPGKRRKLVAQRFAGAGGHDEEEIASCDGGAADFFLVGAKGGKPEGVAQQSDQIAGLDGKIHRCKEIQSLRPRRMTLFHFTGPLEGMRSSRDGAYFARH